MRFHSSGRLFIDDDFVSDQDFTVEVLDRAIGADFFFADMPLPLNHDRHVVEIEWRDARYRLDIVKRDFHRGSCQASWPHESQVEASRDLWAYLREAS